MKKKIRKDIEQCLRKLKLKFNPDFTVEIPKNETYGDYSTNVALISAGLNHLKPVTIANRIIKYFENNQDYASITKAGPGFVNFNLSNNIYFEELKSIHKNKNLLELKIIFQNSINCLLS